MDTYNVYLLDGDGRIVVREATEAETEAEAVEKASENLEARQHHHGAELWLRGRLIRAITGVRSKS